MTAPAWFRLLARNRFAISPTRIPFALQVSIYSIINSMLQLVQEGIFGRAIGESEIARPPIFIIGHWRTGTTHLHELLALDESLVAPTTLECFAPAHCLVSGWFLRLLACFLPATRPMDDVLVGWDQPQEDEFALLNLGLRSPYELILFPNHRPVGLEFLDMTDITPRQAEAWEAGLLRFLKQIQLRSNREKRDGAATRRLVLKSPPHTARLPILRKLFPEAQFIHLVRHPYEVFESTVRLWHALCDTQGCQRPRLDRLPNGALSIEQYVLQTMELLYRDFPAQTAGLPAAKLCEVRYEDLVRAPIAEIERIYRSFDLGAFEPIRPRLECHLLARRGPAQNPGRISQECEVEISRRWRWYMERYGYGSSIQQAQAS
jgi:omega-hydroxy-beta-dihydromenaquinone-9 sulfotransferase